MLFAGWEVRINCDRGLENAARGIFRYSGRYLLLQKAKKYRLNQPG